MSGDGYKKWDSPASESDAPSLAGYKKYEPPSAPAHDWMEDVGTTAKGALYGAGAGAGAFLGRGLLRRAFPGMRPQTSALKRLDEAIKKGDSSSGLKPMFSNYIREVSATDKPLTFADYIAQQKGHGTASAVIKDMIANSGNIPKIEEKLTDRASDSKDRVLNDIASALGVPKQSVVMGKDALIESRKTKAQPLYDAAFADDRPIKDRRFFELFEAPAARKALTEAVTNAENRLKPMDVRSASNERRRDWWKFASQKDIPEGLFLDEEGAGGLRRYIAPNMKNADAIQKSLRQQMEAAMEKDAVTGYDKHTEKSRALKELHDKYMQAMYDVAPNDAYRQARQVFAGDSKLIEAHKVGSELMTMTPDEARKAIKGMTPDQREALSQGFYGYMNDMSNQKFLRELVARPGRYPEHREVLSTVFRDPAKLDQFMANLRGEGAFADSAATFGNAPPSKDPGPRLPWMRISDAPIGPGGLDIGGNTSARLVANLTPKLGWPSTRASRAGTDIAFREPTLGQTTSHPDWGKIEGTDLTGSEILKRVSKWTAAGGASGAVLGGGLSAYNALDQE